MRYFNSDNYAGVHPAVMQALAQANEGRSPSYGGDALSKEATELFKKVFGATCRVGFVFTGTAANVLSIKNILRPYEGVVCATSAHIATDECGAVEHNTGCRLITVPHVHGKITPDSFVPLLRMRGSVHTTYPKIVSISQLTELGTAYTLDELRAMSKWCRAHNFYLHMDGARLANAAAAAGVSLAAMTSEAGVDVLSFGGAKNGLMFGEAVVFLNQALGHEFGYYQKQSMQLGSKMRFVAAQFIAYLTDELWRKCANHANAMAERLNRGLEGIPYIKIVHQRGGNELFVRLPNEVQMHLGRQFSFYVIDPFDEPGFPENYPLIRLVTAFDTQEEEVDDFIEAVRKCEDKAGGTSHSLL